MIELVTGFQKGIVRTNQYSSAVSKLASVTLLYSKCSQRISHSNFRATFYRFISANMQMDNSYKRTLKVKNKKGKDRLNKDFNKDRRSGTDRRKKGSSEYFKNGGIERRSWNERRNLWYMTM